MSYHIANIAEGLRTSRIIRRGLSHSLLTSVARAFTLTISLTMAGVTIRATEPKSSARVQPKGAAASVERSDRVNNLERKRASELLYVLDSDKVELEEESAVGAPRYRGQVLLVDSGGGHVVRTFKAGYRPDMTLSQDGKRLYIASTWWTRDRWGGGTLDLFDTASGALLKRVDNPDRGLSTVPEYPSKMVISQNGRWLYIYKVHQTLDGDEHYVATFDAVKGRFLSQVQKTPFCGGYGTLQPLLADRQLAVVCRESSNVRFLDLTPKSKAGSGARLPRTYAINEPRQTVSILSKGVSEHGRRVGPSFLSSDGATLTVIMGDGRFLRIDNGSRTVLESDTVDREARTISSGATGIAQPTSQDWLTDSWIRYQAPALSPDGSKLYVGIGRLVHLSQGVQLFDRIAVFDPKTMKRLGIIKTSQLFFSFTLSKDGRYLYAISREQAAIIVVDTAAQQEVRTIYGIGKSPIFAIVAP